MTEAIKAKQGIVREILVRTPNGFDFKYATYFSEIIAEILDDDSKKKLDSSGSSKAAEEIHKILLNWYGGSPLSADATNKLLFLAVGRSEELAALEEF